MENTEKTTDFFKLLVKIIVVLMLAIAGLSAPFSMSVQPFIWASQIIIGFL